MNGKSYLNNRNNAVNAAKRLPIIDMKGGLRSRFGSSSNIFHSANGKSYFGVARQSISIALYSAWERVFPRFTLVIDIWKKRKRISQRLDGLPSSDVPNQEAVSGQPTELKHLLKIVEEINNCFDDDLNVFINPLFPCFRKTSVERSVRQGLFHRFTDFIEGPYPALVLKSKQIQAF